MSSDKPLRGSIGAIRNPESDAAIMAAARELLAEKGYGAFTMSEVARRAHASKPTLYRRCLPGSAVRSRGNPLR